MERRSSKSTFGAGKKTANVAWKRDKQIKPSRRMDRIGTTKRENGTENRSGATLGKTCQQNFASKVLISSGAVKSKFSITPTIRIRRSERHWTQEQLAKKLELTPAYIHLLENGKRQPSLEIIVKLLDIFECGFRELFLVSRTTETHTAQK